MPENLVCKWRGYLVMVSGTEITATHVFVLIMIISSIYTACVTLVSDIMWLFKAMF